MFFSKSNSVAVYIYIIYPIHSSLHEFHILWAIDLCVSICILFFLNNVSFFVNLLNQFFIDLGNSTFYFLNEFL